MVINNVRGLRILLIKRNKDDSEKEYILKIHADMKYISIRFLYFLTLYFFLFKGTKWHYSYFILWCFNVYYISGMCQCLFPSLVLFFFPVCEVGSYPHKTSTKCLKACYKVFLKKRKKVSQVDTSMTLFTFQGIT